MTETLSYHTSVSPSQVPIEIWETILEYATLVPEELGVAEWSGDYDHLQFGRAQLSNKEFFTSSLHQDIKNRLSLSSVSRLWRHIMRAILYRTIVIKNIHSIGNFSALTEGNPFLMGLVRRIDFSALAMYYSVNGDSLGGDLKPEFESLELQHFISKFPNLVIVNVLHDIGGRISTYLPRYNYNGSKGSDTSSCNLQQLSIGIDRYINLGFRLDDHYSKYLRVLRLSDGIMRTPPVKDYASLQLPYLEVLDISGIRYEQTLDKLLSNSSLPKLHSISISIGSSQPTFLKDFWKSFGHQIHTLFIKSGIYNVSCLKEESERLIDIVPTLSNLRQLMMDSILHPNLLRRISETSSIKVFELHAPFNRPMLDDALVNPFNVDIVQLFPKLEIFRTANIPCEREETDLRHEIMFLKELILYLDSWEMSLRSHGINIEMTQRDGRAISSSSELKQIQPALNKALGINA